MPAIKDVKGDCKQVYRLYGRFQWNVLLDTNVIMNQTQKMILKSKQQNNVTFLL